VYGEAADSLETIGVGAALTKLLYLHLIGKNAAPTQAGTDKNRSTEF